VTEDNKKHGIGRIRCAKRRPYKGKGFQERSVECVGAGQVDPASGRQTANNRLKNSLCGLFCGKTGHKVAGDAVLREKKMTVDGGK